LFSIEASNEALAILTERMVWAVRGVGALQIPDLPALHILYLATICNRASAGPSRTGRRLKQVCV